MADAPANAPHPHLFELERRGQRRDRLEALWANHTHWGIRRGGEGTPVTLSVGDGPFRGTQTFTLHWNGNPVNQAPLHADNPTTMVLPAGQTQVTVQLRAAADADGRRTRSTTPKSNTRSWRDRVAPKS